MTTHILSMTYGPKIDAVFSGECKHTTRLVRSDAPWVIGDKAVIHTWTGKPYRSPWGRRLDSSINELVYWNAPVWGGVYQYDRPWGNAVREIDGAEFDEMARLDGIFPPNGDEYIKTLMRLNGLNEEQFCNAYWRFAGWD